MQDAVQACRGGNVVRLSGGLTRCSSSRTQTCKVLRFAVEDDEPGIPPEVLAHCRDRLLLALDQTTRAAPPDERLDVVVAGVRNGWISAARRRGPGEHVALIAVGPNPFGPAEKVALEALLAEHEERFGMASTVAALSSG